MLFIPKNKLTYALCNSSKNICIVFVYMRHKFVSQCIVRPSKQACLTLLLLTKRGDRIFILLLVLAIELEF